MHSTFQSTSIETVQAHPGFRTDTLTTMLVLILSMIFLSACGVRDDETGASAGDSSLPPITGDSTSDYRQPPVSCQIDDMKTWVLQGMLDYYLFADQVDENTPLNNYDNIETLITDLRVSPNDTFSYITDETSHSDRFNEGETVGFGWLLSRTQANEYYFKLLEAGSPLALAGVQRGDRLLEVNSLPAVDFFSQDSVAREAILSSEDNAASATFTIQTPLGVSRTFTTTKARYTLDTVLDTRVIEQNNVQIGYLHFYQFLDTSTEELATAFATLASQNVSELVLDMRYNFGGRVMVANELASYLVGRGKTDDAFAVYQPNEKYRENSATINFVNQSNALNLSRVVILQTDDTCSAAELVTNGLRPFMDVITVGGTSCGKPYATIPNTACSKVMNALELEAVNASGSGGYYDGIAADCTVTEDIGQTLGDRDENLLSAALSYIDNGTCPAASTTRSISSWQALPEVLKPAWFGVSTF
ncbi:S41 family peptidase [Granulosicoccus antarcticus]|uniref:Putative CtpA-like serine protease n=1 Tax=Granulosicoccus antarcticus IMCC3135 TaxID=1192854 RepID=A0A2Z2P0H9_9GAMM|nr:S41 family peptidase [Granulosicoccus antarcticus]ASJ75608.1 putative CtpA-like serine protease [Granulosicoccus antarcticus IMCC3135]